MTATLPDDVKHVFESFITTEYTTIDRSGQPITWPVTPYYSPGGDCIEVTTGLGYPKKANDAEANPKVALLFSEPKGSGLADSPMVLVQGTARVDDADLEANRERYMRESLAKLPGAKDALPPRFMQGWFGWYYTRLYVKVRPERVYVWPNADASREPELLDSHMEEVRSGRDEEPESDPPAPAGGEHAWDGRMETLNDQYRTGVLSVVAPDGFPFSVRLPVTVDADEQVVRLESAPLGVPLLPGRACLAVHDHDETFSWQQNFHVRGDLLEDGDGRWIVVPRKLVGGFELPPGSMLSRMRLNASKMRRFHKVAKRELAKRGS